MTKLLIDKAVVEQALPCPFCGHVGLDFSEGSTFRWIVAECGGCGASRGETRIKTYGEGSKADWMADAQADAIREWNTRASIAQAEQPVVVPQGLVQYLESMLHHCKSPLMLQIKEAQQQAKELEAWLSWLSSASHSPAPAVPEEADKPGVWNCYFTNIPGVGVVVCSDGGISAPAVQSDQLEDCNGVIAGPAVPDAAKPEMQGERAELLKEFQRATVELAHLHREYVGKVMPDEIFEHFAKVRDETIPALRAALLAAGPAHVEPLTYKNQPDNIGAWRLGEACARSAKSPGGDWIDRGLSLLKELQEKGYGVVSLSTYGIGKDQAS